MLLSGNDSTRDSCDTTKLFSPPDLFHLEVRKRTRMDINLTKSAHALLKKSQLYQDLMACCCCLIHMGRIRPQCNDRGSNTIF